MWPAVITNSFLCYPQEDPIQKRISLILVVTLTAVTVSVILAGIGPIPPQIVVSPHPATIDDPLRIEAFGVSGNGCVPIYESHQIIGNVIRVDAIVEGSITSYCTQVILPWGFMVEVGNMPSGWYQADLYIADHHISPIPYLVVSKSFYVFEEIYPVYLPIVVE